jgi:hypothetical protein
MGTQDTCSAHRAPSQRTSLPSEVRMYSTGTVMLYAASHSASLLMSRTCRRGAADDGCWASSHHVSCAAQ